MSDPGELVFDLEPRRFKNFAEANVQTARGKRNRIAIGQPLCMSEGPDVDDGLLEDHDLLAYPIDEYSFFRLRFDVTLLPDLDCRVASADLVLAIEPTLPKDNVPLFLRLKPVDDATGARLSSFGTGTREAGWRFERTEVATIPLSTRGLEALVVLRRGAVGKVRFRLAAKIDVYSALDKWMTLLFSRGLPAIADFDFPSESEEKQPAKVMAPRNAQAQEIPRSAHEAEPVVPAVAGSSAYHDETLQLHRAALGAGLGRSRQALLAGISDEFVASLPSADNPSAQILSDINVMMSAGALQDGIRPLMLWLQNAAQLARPRQWVKIFEVTLQRHDAANKARGDVNEDRRSRGDA